MIKALKYRIYPTHKQETQLGIQLEEMRWLYNHCLAERKNAYEQTGKSPGLYDQQKTFPQLKASRPSLLSCNAQSLQNVAVRVDLAFQAYFRRVKQGDMMRPGRAFPVCCVAKRKTPQGGVATLSLLLTRPTLRKLAVNAVTGFSIN